MFGMSDNPPPTPSSSSSSSTTSSPHLASHLLHLPAMLRQGGRSWSEPTDGTLASWFAVPFNGQDITYLSSLKYSLCYTQLNTPSEHTSQEQADTGPGRHSACSLCASIKKKKRKRVCVCVSLRACVLVRAPRWARELSR